MARKSKLQGPADSGDQGGDNGAAERDQGLARRALVGQIDPQPDATLGSVSQSILDLLAWETQELAILKKTGAFEVDDLVRLELVSKILKNIPAPDPRMPSTASVGPKASPVSEMSTEALEKLLEASNG